MAYQYPKFPAWDALLDELHQSMICGCKDCAPAESGRITVTRRDHGGYWLRIVLPDGTSVSQEGCTLNDAARKWLAAMEDRLERHVQPRAKA